MKLAQTTSAHNGNRSLGRYHRPNRKKVSAKALRHQLWVRHSEFGLQRIIWNERFFHGQREL